MSLLAASLVDTARFRARGPNDIGEIAARYGLPDEMREAVRLVSMVLPFRVNDYVLANLVDWDDIPDDPIFQLLFPQPGMLDEAAEKLLTSLLTTGAAPAELKAAIAGIRAGLNPHPSGQMQLNVPTEDGEELPGMQHKYRETVLYFPGSGQTCHAYCTYCFRWAQFVGDPSLRFAAPNPTRLVTYLGTHPEVSDVLVTGGDPMIMSTSRLRSHIEPLLAVESVRTIRIGTKSIAYWPLRYTTDADADDLLRLMEEVVASGRTMAIMAHFTHPRELSTQPAQEAIARIRSTGAVVYCQAPVVAHVNDDAATLAALWRAEFNAGAVPYYMFVERDTGPHDYFRVPLARVSELFRSAYRTLPGLARTVRGPIMSATPGKVAVDGIESGPDGRYFQLRFLQARNPALIGRPFRALWDPTASWLDELQLDASVPPDIASAIESSRRAS